MVGGIANWENIRGFGPIDFQGTGRVSRCRNRILPCPEYGESGCCKIGACPEICMTWIVYGETDRYGKVTPVDVDTYSGTIVGASIDLVWEDRSGSCWLVLYVDDAEQGAVEKCGEYESVSCEDPSYTFTDVEIGYETGDLEFLVEPRHKLARKKGTPAGQCKVAIALVWDRNWRQDIATEDIQSGGLTAAVDALAADSDEYALATVLFNDATDSVHTAFATNNKVGWLADIETITTSGGATVTVEYNRRSDLGLETAVSGLTWPADATKKIIIMVNQGRPDTAMPITPGNAKEVDQLASATAAQAAGITVHTIQIPNIFAGATPSFYHGTGNIGVAQQTASNGGGSYREANPDGTADYNGGVNAVVAAIESLFDGVTCDGGTCATLFCGDTDCTCDRLCLTVNRTEPDCNGTSIMEWAATQGCEKNGWGDPKWEGEVSCGDAVFDVVLELGKNEYDQCVVFGSANDYEGQTFALDEVVVSGDSINATWTLDDSDGYGTITFTVSCLICDACAGIEVECCPDVLLPATIYAEMIQVTAGSFEDCSCAEGIYPLNNLFLQGSPSEPAGQWTSGKMAWLPCTGGSAETWKIDLTCLAGVWTLFVTWFDADDNDLGGGTTNNPTAEVCDPLELTFAPSTPGAIIDSGLCQGGITPALNKVIVTL